MAKIATGKARISLPQSWVDFPDRNYLEINYPSKDSVAATDKAIREAFAKEDTAIIEGTRPVKKVANTATKNGKEIATTESTVKNALTADNLQANAKLDGNEIPSFKKYQKGYTNLNQWVRLFRFPTKEHSITIDITTTYNNYPNQTTKLIIFPYDCLKANFRCLELSTSDVGYFISKIRLTRTKDGYCYFDFYTKNIKNKVTFECSDPDVELLVPTVVEDIPTDLYEEYALTNNFSYNGEKVSTSKNIETNAVDLDFKGQTIDVHTFFNKLETRGFQQGDTARVTFRNADRGTITDGKNTVDFDGGIIYIGYIQTGIYRVKNVLYLRQNEVKIISASYQNVDSKPARSYIRELVNPDTSATTLQTYNQGIVEEI